MKIKKTFQGELPENRIVNTYSNSLTDAYSANYLNDKLKSVEVSSTEPTNGKDIWVQMGKNLFDKTKIISNLSPTSDGGFTGLSGCYTSYVKVEPGMTYMVSSNVNRPWVFNFAKSIPAVGVVATPWNIANGTAFQVTVPDGFEYISFRHLDTSEGENNVNQDIQVEQGEFKTDYEPYMPKKIYIKKDNGYELVYDEANTRKEVYVGPYEPKSGEEVWIQKSNNLYDKSNETGRISVSDGTNRTDSAWVRTSGYIEVKPNTTYTNTVFPDFNQMVILYYNGTQYLSHEIKITSSYGVFTTPDGCNRVRFSFDHSKETQCVLLQGRGKATEYIPYIADKKIFVKNANGVYGELYSYSDIRALNNKFNGLGQGVYANADGGNDVNISSHGHGLYWMNTNWGNGFFIWNGNDLDCYCGRGDANGYTLDIHVRASGLVSAWALNSEGNITSYPKIYTIIKVSNF